MHLRTQHSLRRPNLSQPEELKSDCALKSAQLTALYAGFGYLYRTRISITVQLFSQCAEPLTSHLCELFFLFLVSVKNKTKTEVRPTVCTIFNLFLLAPVYFKTVVDLHSNILLNC